MVGFGTTKISSSIEDALTKLFLWSKTLRLGLSATKADVATNSSHVN